MELITEHFSSCAKNLWSEDVKRLLASDHCQTQDVSSTWTTGTCGPSRSERQRTMAGYRKLTDRTMSR